MPTNTAHNNEDAASAYLQAYLPEYIKESSGIVKEVDIAINQLGKLGDLMDILEADDDFGAKGDVAGEKAHGVSRRADKNQAKAAVTPTSLFLLLVSIGLATIVNTMGVDVNKPNPKEPSASIIKPN